MSDKGTEPELSESEIVELYIFMRYTEELLVGNAKALREMADAVSGKSQKGDALADRARSLANRLSAMLSVEKL